MLNKQTYEATEKLADTIFNLCVEFAKNEGLPYSFVFGIVGDGFQRLSKEAEEMGK